MMKLGPARLGAIRSRVKVRPAAILGGLVTAAGCGDGVGPPPGETSGTVRSLTAVRHTPAGFVAVGSEFAFDSNGVVFDSDRPLIIRSVDGREWSRATVPGEGGLLGLAHGDGRYVAVGGRRLPDRPLVLVSDDAVTWRSPARTPDVVLQSISFGVGRFAALSVDPGPLAPTIWTSADGETWNVAAGLAFPGFEIGRAGDRFLVWGESNAVASSADAVSWDLSTIPGVNRVVDLGLVGGELVGNAVLDCCFGEVPEAVAYFDLSAADPRSWTAVQRTGPRVLFFGRAISAGTHVAVAGGGTAWRASGAFGPWTRTLETEQALADVAFGGDSFVAVGHGVLFASGDGGRWTRIQIPR